MNGKFISLEGGEGAGKSTVLSIAREILLEQGKEVVLTREPGGTDVGEALRKILLDPSYRAMCPETELLMMFASRAQLVREIIKPALDQGKWVLTDRFTDASYAYQGGGRGQPLERIAELESWAAEITPDLTLLLDLSVTQGLQRAGNRASSDRIEMENVDFFQKVRDAYRDRADLHKSRYRMIDASLPLDQVLEQVKKTLHDFIERTNRST